ncbi:hypothetical protein EUGRSUZ_A01703 [Eucalyptus grandis]|uniref:Uncharacterized protein n=2 Tax=Eucalyptus grandis TaxID=71139 RepID=A0ACC3LH12_EUCGR|nr:hypothetical protein EUGRSUZ_A01703 [Eucalyptus grandis]
MSYIQSPLHSHILSLRHLSQHFQTGRHEIQSETVLWNQTNLLCQFCIEDFINCSNSIYCCEKCGFYIHALCARSASLQIQHPRHQHPLYFQQESPLRPHGDYRCVEFDRGCHYKLGRWTAMTTLQVEKYYCSILREASDGESRLQFAHEHPLTTFPVRTGTPCGGCEMRISEEEEACGCRECKIFLHEACAKAPLEIQHHPFHPKHPLYLYLSYDSSCEGECHACRSFNDMGPIRYRCEECKLIFHLSCVISTMPREGEDDDDDDDDDGGEREDISRRPSVIDHPLHPHQLSSYHSKTQTWIRCSICKEEIPSEDFFGCSDCSFFLHGSCAQPTIQHYLHPEHALTFAQCPDEKHKCAVCGDPVDCKSYCYTCQMCDLLIHPFCASAALSDLEKGVARTVQYPFHEHELKHYYQHDYCGHCTVCARQILEKTPAYKCFSKGCNFELHESCLQLSSHLVHPSHSLHALTLCFSPRNKDTVCRRCNERISGTFAFSCGVCNFYLHVVCAQIPTTLKHPFHEHHLFYFKVQEYQRKCRACHKSCSIDLFSCEQCDYTLHYECSQFPLTLKSEHHSYCDPLVLRKSFIEDERSEYYCDICERRRDPQKWVYFCETCDYNFVAHVECALSPVGRFSKFPFLLLWNLTHLLN